MTGHAIEARLCAEDPASGFLPSTGPIVHFDPPSGEGIRVDSGIEQGSVISPYYDSMIAKLIAHGPDRAAAVARLSEALEQTAVAGPRTNAAFLHALLAHPAFRSGEMETGLIGRELATLAPAGLDTKAIGFGVMHMLWHAHDDAELARGAPAGRWSPWSVQDAFQLGGPRRQRLTILAGGRPMPVDVAWGATGPAVTVPGDHAEPPWPRRSIRVVGEGTPLYVLHDMRQTELRWPTYEADAADAAGDGTSVRAPIVGRVAKVFVQAGDAVAKGDRIAVVEAMKMEHVLHAPRDGTVETVPVNEGDQVVQGALVAVLGE
jgi:3-methylcrotonyl-CoA carboxylase alpha subunit